MSATALTCRCRGRGGKIIPVKKGIRILGLIGITGVGCKGAGSRESGLDICIFPSTERKMCLCVHTTFLHEYIMLSMMVGPRLSSSYEVNLFIEFITYLINPTKAFLHSFVVFIQGRISIVDAYQPTCYNMLHGTHGYS